MSPSQNAIEYMKQNFHHGDEFMAFLTWVLTGEGSHIFAKAEWRRWTHTTEAGLELLMAECGNIAKIRLIEQNPNKKSEWAALARDGSTVFQVTLNNAWYGVIVNRGFMIYGQEEATI